MSDFLQYTLITILSMEFIIGNLGNAFIAVVNITDWVKRKTISSVDLILTALAISRTALLWSLFTSLWIYMQCSIYIITGKMIRMCHISWTLSNHFSIWLATCLSIFYFLKIPSFSNSLFLYLKWRINNVISMIFLASLLILFTNMVIINIQIESGLHGYKANMSYCSFSNNFVKFPRSLIFINTIFTFIPFTVSLMTFLLLIFSLLKHLRNSSHNFKGSRDVSTTAHIKALQTVVAFLLLYTVFFVSHVLLFQNTVSQLERHVVLFLFVTGICFPSVHSCILILGNSRLRQASRSVLRWIRCRNKDAELLSP